MKPDVVLLVTALRTLPGSQRTAIVLHYLTDLSVEQVAHEMRSPVGTVKAWLSRGRKALADQLSDPANPSSPALTRSESS